jgi:hypothetical protein
VGVAIGLSALLVMGILICLCCRGRRDQAIKENEEIFIRRKVVGGLVVDEAVVRNTDLDRSYHVVAEEDVGLGMPPPSYDSVVGRDRARGA